MPKAGGATALFIDWIGVGSGVGPGFHGVGAGARGVGVFRAKKALETGKRIRFRVARLGSTSNAFSPSSISEVRVRFFWPPFSSPCS
jgi:hypothetical protein